MFKMLELFIEFIVRVCAVYSKCKEFYATIFKNESILVLLLLLPWKWHDFIFFSLSLSFQRT